jgi:hypothetical protein
MLADITSIAVAFHGSHNGDFYTNDNYAASVYYNISLS